MTARCTVRGCKSGSYADKQQKTRSGARQTTVFAAPKSSVLLQKWSTLLNQGITAKDRVCELHFADKDIIRSNDTLMPDGTIFSIPRQKYTLIKNAIPIDSNNQENNAPENQEYSTNQKTIDINIEEPLNKSHNENITSISGEISTESDTTDPLIIDLENKPHVETATVKPDVINTSVKCYANNSFLNDHQYFIDKEKPDQYIYYNKLVAAYITIPRLNDPTLEQKTTTIEENTRDPVTNLEELPSNFENQLASQLTIESILDYLVKTPLQRSWCWMNCTRKDNGITFTQIDCKSRQIRCFVQLHEDLSITIQTGDDKISLEIDIKLTSVESILNMLQTIGRMRICTGSGMERDGRDENCTGIVIPNEEYKIQMYRDRCMACRRLRKLVQHRDNNCRADLKVKYERVKKEQDLLRRKCRRLEEKLNLKNARLKAITEMIKSVNKYNKKQKECL